MNKTTRIRSREHLAFIRSLPCAVKNKRDHVCEGPIEAAHYRGSKDGGGSLKPGDNWTIPLCHLAHIHEQHRIGEPAFERRYGISMGDIAKMLWAIGPKTIDPEPKRRSSQPKKAMGPKKPIQSRPLTDPNFKRTLRRGTVRRQQVAA